MASTLGISSSSRLQPATNERRSHLKNIGFQKGQSGNPVGRPRRDKALRKMARIYSPACIVQLMEIIRDKSIPVYTRMQAARTILSCAYNKNRKIQEMNFHEIEVFAYAVELEYNVGLPKARSWQLAEHLASDNDAIHNRAVWQAKAEQQAMAESENYVADL